MPHTNQIFSLKRFGHCIARDLGENSRRYLLYIGVIAALMLTLSIGIAYTYIDNAHDFTQDPGAFWSQSARRSFANTQMIWMITLFLATITIGASIAFSSLSSKDGRLVEIVSPSSQCEKFFTRIVVFCAGSWIVSLLCWTLAVYATYGLMSLFTSYGEFYRPLSVFPESMGYGETVSHCKILMFFAVFIQSFFFLGSIFWPRASFIKTFGVGFLIAGALILSISYSIMHLEKTIETDFLSEYLEPLPIFTEAATYFTAALALTLINYIIAYMRFKDTDIVCKW